MSESGLSPSPEAGGAIYDGPGVATEGSLGSKMRAGVLFWFLANLAAKLIKVAVHVVLAWWLDPTDYGLVAMTMAIMMILQMLSEFGIGVAVIQKKDMSDSYAVTAFWLNVGASLLMITLAWFAAPALAEFYRDARITLLVRVSSVNFLIIALRTIPMSLLRRQMQFGRYALLDAFWQVASGLLSIVLAFLGWRYWSLVLPAMVTGLLLSPVWFFAARWRPAFRFDMAIFSEVFNYVKYVLAASILLLILNNAGFLLAGRFLGSHEAGIYKFAMENGMFIVVNFAWLVGNVILSGFAVQQGQNEKLRATFARVFEILAALTLPFHLLLFALAPLIFTGVFPPRWEPAIPLFRILLVYATLRAMIAHVTPFYNAVGRPEVTARFYAVVVLVSVTSMYLAGVKFGLTGLAWAMSVTQAAGAAAILAITPRVMGWQRIAYLKILFPYAVASVLAMAAAKTIAIVLEGWGVHPALNFFIAGAIGGACYPLYLYFFARSRFTHLLAGVLPGWIQKKMPSFLGLGPR